MSTTTGPAGRRRKWGSALLIGGMVVGMGALVTMNEWTEPRAADQSETSETETDSGHFNLERSLSGLIYTDRVYYGQAVQFDFKSSQMEPGETVYQPLAVRLDAETTTDGTIQAGSGLNIARTRGDNITDFSLQVFEGLSSCDAEGTEGAEPIGSRETLTQGNILLSDDIPLSAGEGDEAGDPLDLCFAVTSDSMGDPEPEIPARVIWSVQALQTP